MALTTIVVPIRGDGRGEGILAHAAAIGRAQNAHIVAVHCRVRPEDLLPFGVVLPRWIQDQIKAQADELATGEEGRLREEFAAVLARLDFALVEDGEVPADRPSATWIEERGRQADVIRDHGRLGDLVAVAQPDRGGAFGVNTLKSALVGTARPVLLCPQKPAPERLGRRIALAWNGSLEATRAVATTLGITRAADEIVVLDGGSQSPVTSGENVARYYARQGVPARVVRLESSGHVGRAILRAAGSEGADLLLMGAYSQSQELETVFGGVTQEVVDEAEMPVLMAH